MKPVSEKMSHCSSIDLNIIICKTKLSSAQAS